MRQSHSGWVERRPLSASGAKARPASPRQPLSGRATTDFTDKAQSAESWGPYLAVGQCVPNMGPW